MDDLCHKYCIPGPDALQNINQNGDVQPASPNCTPENQPEIQRMHLALESDDSSQAKDNSNNASSTNIIYIRPGPVDLFRPNVAELILIRNHPNLNEVEKILPSFHPSSNSTAKICNFETSSTETSLTHATQSSRCAVVSDDNLNIIDEQPVPSSVSGMTYAAFKASLARKASVQQSHRTLLIQDAVSSHERMHIESSSNLDENTPSVECSPHESNINQIGHMWLNEYCHYLKLHNLEPTFLDKASVNHSPFTTESAEELKQICQSSDSQSSETKYSNTRQETSLSEQNSSLQEFTRVLEQNQNQKPEDSVKPHSAESAEVLARSQMYQIHLVYDERDIRNPYLELPEMHTLEFAEITERENMYQIWTTRPEPVIKEPVVKKMGFFSFLRRLFTKRSTGQPQIESLQTEEEESTTSVVNMDKNIEALGMTLRASDGCTAIRDSKTMTLIPTPKLDLVVNFSNERKFEASQRNGILQGHTSMTNEFRDRSVNRDKPDVLTSGFPDHWMKGTEGMEEIFDFDLITKYMGVIGPGDPYCDEVGLLLIWLHRCPSRRAGQYAKIMLHLLRYIISYLDLQPQKDTMLIFSANTIDNDPPASWLRDLFIQLGNRNWKQLLLIYPNLWSRAKFELGNCGITRSCMFEQKVIYMYSLENLYEYLSSKNITFNKLPELITEYDHHMRSEQHRCAQLDVR